MNNIHKKIDEVSFLVVDFETVTPKGRPPEPIELAALTIKKGLKLDESLSVEWLIQPPYGAPITRFDTAQTGITWEHVKNKPFIETILCEFEKLLLEDDYIIVAQNAKYEAAIFRRFETLCPSFSKMQFIDTILLAKSLLPNLANYKLDTLATFFSIPLPVDRHRALPDIKITAKVLLGLINLGQKEGKIKNLEEIIFVAGLENKNLQSVQQSLFD